MIPEVSIDKSEACPSTMMTAHELYTILTMIFLRNQNQNEELYSKMPYVNSLNSLSEDEINKLILEYAYRGSDITYASS